MGTRTRVVVAWCVVAMAAGCGDGGGEATPGTGGGPSGMGGASSSAGGGSATGGAATTGAGGDGGGTRGAGGGGGTSACAMLSDDFDDPSTLACWTRRHQVAGEAAQYDLLDVDTTVPGALAIEPLSSGWFEEDMGTLLYKEITGDFVVEVDVSASEEGDPGTPPSMIYHSAGLMVRDPASVPGAQNWLMYNVGYQETFVGTEGKTTVDSESVLTLLPGGHVGRLRICRVGSTFTMWRQLEGEVAWAQEHSYDRADLPATLQLGLITNAWPPAMPLAPRNVQGRFDYVHVGDAAAESDCTAAIVAR